MTESLVSLQDLNHIARLEWSKVAAILNAELNDLGMAEDVTQEAFTEALNRWPTSGVPQRPGAWLTTVARRRAIDKIRREVTGRDKTELLARLEQRLSPAAVAVDASLVRDEQLQLIFSCCHPALSIETQIALTLRCVAGLSTADISTAMIASDKALAQRIVRGKRKIKESVIPLAMPTDQELVDRLAVVHQVIYLIFNNGYVRPESTVLSAVEFTAEAIRLARLIAELMPEDPETKGLLSLLLFTDARSQARSDSNNEFVRLEDQDRSLWDQEKIFEAHAILEKAIKLDRNGPFQIQAAISALHCDASNFERTDWLQIELLYRSLLKHSDTPVIRLNLAIAVSMAKTPEEGLALVKPLACQLTEYHYYHSALADLYKRLGESAKARDSYENALKLVTNQAEASFLKKQLNSLADSK